jgi:hypothetical protein
MQNHCSKVIVCTTNLQAAGGFLYVAHILGLKTTRRPNGFWYVLLNEYSLDLILIAKIS